VSSHVTQHLEFLPVRVCMFHGYFQLVFKGKSDRAVASEIRNDLIGKYYEKLNQCYQDRYSLSPPSQWIKQLPLVDGENHLSLHVQLNDGEHVTVPLHIWKLESDVKLILSDVDGTVTTREYGSSTFRKGVKNMYQEIASDRSVLFTYLTVRPFKRTERIRKLLTVGGFPRGPILTVPYETIDSIEGFSHGIATQLKTIHVEGLMTQGIKCHAGFGNRNADQNVYDQANIPKERQVLNVWGSHGLIKGSHFPFQEVPEVIKNTPATFPTCKDWKCRALYLMFCTQNSVDRVLGKSYSKGMALFYNVVTTCRKSRSTHLRTNQVTI